MIGILGLFRSFEGGLRHFTQLSRFSLTPFPCVFLDNVMVSAISIFFMFFVDECLSSGPGLVAFDEEIRFHGNS